MALSDSATLRAQMVERQIAARGVRDARVLAALRDVPRERFVPASHAAEAWADRALPIEAGQTISQPYVVALMAEALRIAPSDRVLEIGTGSGYAAAVLSRLAREVYTVERHAGLAERALGVLRSLGFWNVHVRIADGTLGWREEAPFDAILVSAAGPRVPPTLESQLARGGRLVMPVGGAHGGQRLLRSTRLVREDFAREDLGDVQFVPLVGVEGFAE